MIDEALPHWLPYAFPFLFVGMWLFVTTVLGFLSGWFNLQKSYPDAQRDEPLLRLGGQSGSMGLGVAFNGCLVLRSYRSGIGLSVWRLIGPFQKPLLIPWGEIRVTEKQQLFGPSVRLDFGRSSIGKLTIRSEVWQQLKQVAKPNTA